MVSDFRATPGPEVVVTPRAPPNAAPMPEISSSAWKVRTPTAVAIADTVAADPALARAVVRSARQVIGPPALSWEVALELELNPQLWSMDRRGERRSTPDRDRPRLGPVRTLSEGQLVERGDGVVDQRMSEGTARGTKPSSRAYRWPVPI
ncbi:hypothetical protein AB0D27_24425 [Streptomyces sp. NPDC048415]|uniref:hypothetical protein n=1 Tax=Streptomyces sp. NPDC048415 TaxID=3154822 RepID=UPI00342E19F1